MGVASENLTKIIERMNNIPKAQQVFVTDIGGKSVNWEMTFQFNLNGEVPFFLEVKEKNVKLVSGTADNAEIVMSGNNESIVKICNGKGDFTHAISREEITVEKGRVIEVIRLTRAITIVLKTK